MTPLPNNGWGGIDPTSYLRLQWDSNEDAEGVRVNDRMSSMAD